MTKRDGSAKTHQTQGVRIIEMQIAPSLHRLGSSIVNSYLVEDAGGVTIIDAGLPGYWNYLPK